MTTNHSHSNTDPNAPEAERTGFADPRCARCGAVLAGRRRDARFCSDKCRMQTHRQGEQARIAGLLATLEQTITELKSVLEGRHED
jgi:hypothetical protein